MNDNRPGGPGTAGMDYSTRYRTLFDSIDEGFCIIEFFDGPHGELSDYVHIEANPAYARSCRHSCTSSARSSAKWWRTRPMAGSNSMAACATEPASRSASNANSSPPAAISSCRLFVSSRPARNRSRCSSRTSPRASAPSCELRAAERDARGPRRGGDRRAHAGAGAAARGPGGAAAERRRWRPWGSSRAGSPTTSTTFWPASRQLELMGTAPRAGAHHRDRTLMVAAQGAASRAATLTHRLLAFSRRQTLAPKLTDVNRPGRRHRGTGPSHCRTAHRGRDLRPPACGRDVDPNQLENALLNLCINARDAMPEAAG